MPAVTMLGRRWSFATDDVPLMGFFPTMFHGLWALILMVIWIVFGKHRDCYDGTPFTVVLAGLFITFTMFFIIGCWATYEGLKGGVACLILQLYRMRKASHVLGECTSGMPVMP